MALHVVGVAMEAAFDFGFDFFEFAFLYVAFERIFGFGHGLRVDGGETENSKETNEYCFQQEVSCWIHWSGDGWEPLDERGRREEALGLGSGSSAQVTLTRVERYSRSSTSSM